jgi:membrane-bound serine protease (ClpP class)
MGLCRLGAILLFLAVGAGQAAAQGSTVLVTRVDGPITPVSADHLLEGVERAEQEGHVAIVVELDTPGGLDDSMREIVQAFLNARVPVVVYVSPSGARAASAGTFVTMAAHVAAMAPGTSIGAATPVDLGGGEITDKIINDAVAFAVSVAEVRNRSTEFAETAVREGRSITATEAVEEEVVDLIAGDLAGLLQAIDGREVELGGGASVRLETVGAEEVRYEMGALRRILERLADPNLAFLFLSVGTLAILYELANPGMGLGGIMGVILLILGFFALAVLPFNLAGIALLVLAAGLLAAELFVPGVGVFAAGGAIALVLAGIFLFEGSLAVSPTVLWPVAVVVGLGSLLAGRLAWRARRAPALLGEVALQGRTATVETAVGQTGQLLLDGAWWTARSRGRPLRPGDTVEVVGMEGLELIVEPREAES